MYEIICLPPEYRYEVVKPFYDTGYIVMIQDKPVLIDEEDLYKVLGHSWCYCNKYLQTKVQGSSLYIHRHIIKAKKGEEVDHINRDIQDNRKSNLRIANRRINLINREKGGTGYVWVRKAYRKSSIQKYSVRIKYKGKSWDFGTSYKDKKEAAKIGDAVNYIVFGDETPSDLYNFPTDVQIDRIPKKWLDKVNRLKELHEKTKAD